MWNLFKTNCITANGISVIIGRRGRLTYEEGTEKFLINAVEGDGFGIVVEEMGDADLALMRKTLDQRLKIALNIRDVLAKRKIIVDVYMGNRVIH